jgi:hypothetical protein
MVESSGGISVTSHVNNADPPASSPRHIPGRTNTRKPCSIAQNAPQMFPLVNSFLFAHPELHPLMNTTQCPSTSSLFWSHTPSGATARAQPRTWPGRLQAGPHSLPSCPSSSARTRSEAVPTPATFVGTLVGLTCGDWFLDILSAV